MSSTPETPKKFNVLAVHVDRSSRHDLNHRITRMLEKFGSKFNRVLILQRKNREPQLSPKQELILTKSHLGALTDHATILTGWYAGHCVLTAYKDILEAAPVDQPMEFHLPLDVTDVWREEAGEESGATMTKEEKLALAEEYFQAAEKSGRPSALYLDGQLLHGTPDGTLKLYIHSSNDDFLRDS
jgi:hypothetical protein